jgi:Spy/CpxP family protein refolding chaperone
MRISLRILGVLAALALPAAAPGASERPYAGLEQRPVKALSEQEAADLLAGRGMGFALSAELNGLPGPRHVLDLADALRLDAAQRAAIGRLFEEMRDSAVALGRRVVEREAALDRLFAAPRPDEAAIKAAVAEIAALRGDLRFLHLGYHLTTRDLLTPEQIAQYRQARGYGPAQPAPAGHGHGQPH